MTESKKLAVGDKVTLKDNRKGVVKQLGTNGQGVLVEVAGNSDGHKFETSWFASDTVKASN